MYAPEIMAVVESSIPLIGLLTNTLSSAAEVYASPPSWP